MSTSVPTSSQPSTTRRGRIRDFWQRVSEGRDIDDLWSQFAADTRSSYSFYGKDVDWELVNKLPAWKRPFRVAVQLFWAMMNKLTPARRVLLLAGFVFLFLSGMHFEVDQHTSFDINFELLAAILFLLLLFPFHSLVLGMVSVALTTMLLYFAHFVLTDLDNPFEGTWNVDSEAFRDLANSAR